MTIVTLSLPDVKRKTEIRPRVCPYCEGKTFQRWGKVIKPVKDNRHRTSWSTITAAATAIARSDTILLGSIEPIEPKGCVNYPLSSGCWG